MHPGDEGIQRPSEATAATTAFDEWIAGLPPELLELTAREVFDLARAERALGAPSPALRAALVETSTARRRAVELLTVTVADLRHQWAEANRLFLQHDGSDLDTMIEAMRIEEQEHLAEVENLRLERRRTDRQARADREIKRGRALLARLREADPRHATIGNYQHAGALLGGLHPPTERIGVLVKALEDVRANVGLVVRATHAGTDAELNERIEALGRAVDGAEHALNAWLGGGPV